MRVAVRAEAVSVKRRISIAIVPPGTPRTPAGQEARASASWEGADLVVVNAVIWTGASADGEGHGRVPYRPGAGLGDDVL